MATFHILRDASPEQAFSERVNERKTWAHLACRTYGLNNGFERMMIQFVPAASGETCRCVHCRHTFAVRYAGEQICGACRGRKGRR